MRHKRSVRSCLALAMLLSGCAHGASPTPEPETSARIAGPLKPGDCVEARRRASLQPDLEVDRLPAPVTMKPAPFRDVPASALRKDGSAEIKIDVLVDTLGKADLSTFKVVKVSNKWFTSNVRSVIGKWTFTPAMLAGCKVPRVYHFMSSVAPRTAEAK
jgi:PBP1b-binding outer membrane lipoprotein LpoB